MEYDCSSGTAGDEQMECNCAAGKMCGVKDTIDPMFKHHYRGQMIKLMHTVIDD
ncbi:hypothetical protein M9458_056265, partial [Cirrhinus mrigala]